MSKQTFMKKSTRKVLHIHEHQFEETKNIRTKVWFIKKS